VGPSIWQIATEAQREFLSSASVRERHTFFELLKSEDDDDIEKGLCLAYRTVCSHHLRRIYAAALDYSLENGSFPIGGGEHSSAHESLNVLLRSPAGADLRPEHFVCPAIRGGTANLDKNGKFLLKEEHLSYAWVARRTKPTGKLRPLASHKDSLPMWCQNLVLYTDGSIKTLDVRVHPEDYDYLSPGLTR
jgi:hypothetical protein